MSLILNIFLIISLKRTLNYIDLLESWIADFKILVNNTYKKLKFIDNRNIFEKDDDVGFLFSDLLNIIKITNQRIQSEGSDDDDDIKESSEKNQIKLYDDSKEKEAIQKTDYNR